MLTVLSYNVNFGLAGDRAGIEAIRVADADLVLLQETTPHWERALREQLGADYPHMEFRHGAGAGGLALLSRRPFEDHGLLPAQSWFPAWVVHAQTALGTVQVLNVHLRPPLGEHGSVVSGYFTTPKIREQEISVFMSALDASLPTLVVGDFNEDAGGRALHKLQVAGFRSALPEFSPSAKTWRWQIGVGTLGSCLDHVVYNGQLEPIAVEVLELGRSDHLPLLATFTRRTSAPLRDF